LTLLQLWISTSRRQVREADLSHSILGPRTVAGLLLRKWNWKRTLLSGHDRPGTGTVYLWPRPCSEPKWQVHEDRSHGLTHTAEPLLKKTAVGCSGGSNIHSFSLSEQEASLYVHGSWSLELENYKLGFRHCCSNFTIRWETLKLQTEWIIKHCIDKNAVDHQTR